MLVSKVSIEGVGFTIKGDCISITVAKKYTLKYIVTRNQIIVTQSLLI